MQSAGIVGFAVVIGLLAGCLLGTQPSVNGQLARHVAHPLQATLISFASGTIIIIAVTAAIGIFPPRFSQPPGQLPWWIWCGGAIGVVMVTTSLLLVPLVGSLRWFAAVITGQVLVAVTLDHFGWLGNPRVPASPLRIFGALLLIAGVLVIVQAKRSEGRPAAEFNQPPRDTTSDGGTKSVDGS